MSLSVGNIANQVYEAQSTSKSTWASASLNCNADSLILAICAVGKGSGTAPSFTNVTNNKGLTFTSRAGGKTGVTAGNEILYQYFWARAPSALTGLVATFNWGGACNGDRGDVTLVEIRGVTDWTNPFDMTVAAKGQWVSGSAASYPSLTLTKTKTSNIRFGYWFSAYTAASGAPNLATTDFNANTPSSYYRHALAHDPSSSPSITASYSTATSFAVIGLGDTINGDAPPVPQSRPICVLTG